MKPHTKLLAVTYLVAVALLAMLEFSQFSKVDELRSEIGQSYEMISGRDEGLRLELEYRRFHSKLSTYVNGIDPSKRAYIKDVTHDDLSIWFDILWSRVFSLNIDGAGLPVQHHRKMQQLILEFRETLKAVDPMIQALTPGDRHGYNLIRDRLDKFDNPISELAAIIAQDRQSQASTLQDHLFNALKSIDALLFTSGFGGALLVTLFGIQAYRARMEEAKTKEREARVRFLAEHDTLTGLGNRSFLNKRMNDFIHEFETTGAGFHLLLLDLDKFKDVNDTYGHPMGDRLLKKAAARLVGIFTSEGDVVVRLGGDEFAVLMRGDSEKVERAARKTIEVLSTAFELSGNDLRISTSVGISCYPTLSASADDLMRDADLALYAAKNLGRQTLCFYEHAMSVAIQHRMRLESDLRRAINNSDGGLELYYQPQVTFSEDEANDCLITGVEALVRWFHPEQGQIPTMEFIQIAETSGLIDELSDWIFRQACADVASWHKAGFMLNLSVNLSPIQLNNPRLPMELLGHLQECGFDPHYLTLEITESADVHDTMAAARMLSELASQGISLAMDDFGTGYSNLGYLKSLPLHTLKIDRSFVMQIEDEEEDRKLVRGIINLAQGMGLKVVAEGVETKEQVAFLKSQNCDMGQGYLFGRPMHKLGMLTALNQQYERVHQEQRRLEA